jgi:ketosteroid isomerase-like protein
MSDTNVITTFFNALKRSDHDTVLNCYHEEGTFSDPVFGPLDPRHSKAMWEMLLTNNDDLEVEYEILEQSENVAVVKWLADYTLRKTKRKVSNPIVSNFVLKDGKIFRQVDDYDLYKWSKMALGSSGTLFGWTSLVQNKIREDVLKTLEFFMKAKGR